MRLKQSSFPVHHLPSLRQRVQEEEEERVAHAELAVEGDSRVEQHGRGDAREYCGDGSAEDEEGREG
jgi:hypothetical protein